MNWARIRTMAMKGLVVAAVVAVGFVAGGPVLAIAVGAGVSVAVFSAVAGSER